MSSQPLTDLLPEEILDTALHTMQSEGIEPVEWHPLLYNRMNVPRIVSYYSFLIPDEDFHRASKLLEHMGLPLRPSFPIQDDMQAKGRSHFIGLSEITILEYRLVVYPLSFAAFRSCEISEQPVRYSKLHRCSHILVPRPSAVYASLMRMMLRYPTNSDTWTTLRSDLGEHILYHLMGYTLETISDEDDEEDDIPRADAATQIVREWSARKEWGDGEEWMASALCGLVRGERLCYPPDLSS